MPRLGLVVILALGLVITTPVVCVCGPTDHGGQALHSLLPHSHDHPSATAAHAHLAEPSREQQVGEELGAADALPADSRPDDAPPPSMRAQTGASAGALAAGAVAIGLALAEPWQAPTARGVAVLAPSVAVPPGVDLGPAGPPPRVVLG